MKNSIRIYTQNRPEAFDAQSSQHHGSGRLLLLLQLIPTILDKYRNYRKCDSGDKGATYRFVAIGG